MGINPLRNRPRNAAASSTPQDPEQARTPASPRLPSEAIVPKPQQPEKKYIHFLGLYKVVIKDRTPVLDEGETVTRGSVKEIQDWIREEFKTNQLAPGYQLVWMRVQIGEDGKAIGNPHVFIPPSGKRKPHRKKKATRGRKAAPNNPS